MGEHTKQEERKQAQRQRKR